MTIVTRFPPSPTGMMHIGNARTALFNWFFAKANGGKMLFRIEDTDRKRHSEEAVTALIEALKWLELDWDGEPVSQFENRARHVDVAQQLLSSGKAYKCYCTPEELEEMRETARAQGNAVFYDRRWRERDDAEAPEGRDPVIRIKAPLSGSYTVHDKVQGDVAVQNEQLDDFIILRSDGSPTYMLSVVVDDHDMGVTHVIRGDDHLNNTFRQNIIYDAMNDVEDGWTKPTYAHAPMILGPDGSKMSKRHGAASVEEYRKMGYLPAAMRNYLLRLGWSHGDDEIISTEQGIKWFGLDAIGKSAARFDFDKLENLNAHYIKESSADYILEQALPFYNVDIDEQAKARISAHAEELQSRAKTLIQFAEESSFYAATTPLTFNEKAQEIVNNAKDDVLPALLAALQGLNSFTGEDVQAACKAVAEELSGGKLGKVAMPLRAALTGTTVSPSVFKAAEILGQQDTCARIEAAIG